MRSRRRLIVVGLAGIAVTAPTQSASSQPIWERLLNPKFEVPIGHPPQVLLPDATKLAVLDFRGDPRCGSELTARLAQALAQSGRFQMVDRDRTSTALRDRRLQSFDAASRDEAARLSELIGPASVFTGTITRCSTEQSGVIEEGHSKDRHGMMHTSYVRRATAHLTAAVSLVDLTTAKVRGGVMLDVSDTLSTFAVDGTPEVPSEDAVLSRMYVTAVGRVLPVVLPWTEVVKITAYDDNKCDLKLSAAQMKRGDVVGAAETMKGAVGNSCGGSSDAKLLAKAHYNLGIALTYSGRPEDGLRELQTSQDLRSSSITADALATVRKIIALKESQRVKEMALADGGKGPARQQPPAPARLTNQEVIDMVKADLPENVILKKIASSPCHFDTSAGALIALKHAGASDRIIEAVTDAGAGKCR